MGEGNAADILPTTVLTGFLGSGKTSLLRRALADPRFTDTAVIVNEVGAIAIDHYLVDFVEGAVLELPGGCLCCAVREDLARTLRDLLDRRDAGTVRPFRRLVIETSGLADPAPILYTLGADPMLDARLSLDRVVTVVDAVSGAATLARFAEAARQAAMADALVISKTDLVPFTMELDAALAALNPNAEIVYSAVPAGAPSSPCGDGDGRGEVGETPAQAHLTLPSHSDGPLYLRPRGRRGDDPAKILFGGAPSPHPNPLPPAGEGETAAGACHPIPRWRERVGVGAAEAIHSHGIDSFAIVLDGAMTRLEFAKAMGTLAAAYGSDLLRIKGLVAFADRDGRPALVQAAQHTMFAPEWLDAWPDSDHRSRLVFVVHEVPREAILAHFAFASPDVVGAHASRRHTGGTPLYN